MAMSNFTFQSYFHAFQLPISPSVNMPADLFSGIGTPRPLTQEVSSGQRLSGPREPAWDAQGAVSTTDGCGGAAVSVSP